MMDKFIRCMVPRKHSPKENIISLLLGMVMGLTVFCPLFKSHTKTEEVRVLSFKIDKIECPEVIVEENIYDEYVTEIIIQEDTEFIFQETSADILETLDPIELDIFARCVEAEAGNQGLYGKQLVVDVILNRVKSHNFPDTITDVIMECNSNGVWQFSVVGDGAIDRAVPTEETYEAIRTELTQIQYPSLMYFSAEGYLPYGTPWKKVGGHYFNIGT